MKFKTGFLLGAAAGAWAVSKASQLQRGGSAPARGSSGSDEAAEKIRALSGLARERVADLVDGPLGTMARDRIAELIGASLGGRSIRGDGTIDASARWPD